MLIWLILLPVFAALLIGFLRLPGRAVALVCSVLSLVLAVTLLIGEQTADDVSWLSQFCGWDTQFSLTLPLSQVMLLLTEVVTLAAVAGMKAPDPQAERSWSISTLLISAGATGAFLSDNVISFFAFHELALIPTFVMIGFYGRGERRTIAWRMTIYLGLASMVLLVGLLLLCAQMGTNSFSMMHVLASMGRFPVSSCAVAGLLLMGFGTMVSLFPFHSWAAPAYASAPTPIAMMHAGVLKKFGLYGLLLMAWVFGSRSVAFFGCWTNVLLVLLLGNVLWVGCVTMAQNRLDSMLGNSSVMHMGYIFLGIAAFILSGASNILAFYGAGTLMLAHGLSIALLFLLTGQIESRTKTLEFSALGGLAPKQPALGFFFALAGLASIGLPLLANFVGEFSIFMSCFQGWGPGGAEQDFCFDWLEELSELLGGAGPVQLTVLFALWGLVISAIYMLRAIRRVFTGATTAVCERATQKLSFADLFAAVFLSALLLLFGIAPNLLV